MNWSKDTGPLKAEGHVSRRRARHRKHVEVHDDRDNIVALIKAKAIIKPTWLGHKSDLMVFGAVYACPDSLYRLYIEVKLER